MGSLRLQPRRRDVPPPAPESRQFRRIVRALAELGDAAAVARQLRVAQAHVAHVQALVPAPWACAACGRAEGQAVTDPTRCKPCVKAANDQIAAAARPSQAPAPKAPAPKAPAPKAPAPKAPAPAPSVVVEPPLVTIVPAPPRAEWELLSEAIARMIPRQADEVERYHLRLAFLRARYAPYRRAS